MYPFVLHVGSAECRFHRRAIAKRTGSLSLQRKIIDLQGIKSNLAS
ncbi:MAG: hypothetical protein O4749_00110 [Trichodesmium sp. St5_bin2_1]|nr:hypothetical protein [Trichodesmium sp. St5_bin2_1]